MAGRWGGETAGAPPRADAEFLTDGEAGQLCTASARPPPRPQISTVSPESHLVVTGSRED
jgi:hypothetical protein